MSQGSNQQNTLKGNGANDFSPISTFRKQAFQINHSDRALKNKPSVDSLAKNILEEEHKRFNNVLENLPVYLILLTPDYQVPFANRFFRERLGESNGKRCFEYLFGPTEPCEICETYTVLKTMKPHRWEWLGPDGCWYDIYDMPFTDTEGSTLILEMGVDITKRKKAEIEIDRYHKYLKEIVKKRTAELKQKNLQLAQDLNALQKAEEDIYNLALFPQENPLPVLRVSVEGIILYANPAAVEILKQWQCNVGDCVPSPIQ